MFHRNALIKITRTILKEKNLINFNQFAYVQTDKASDQPASNEEKASITSNQIRKIKIYTKTGDKGKSSLYTGERRFKSDEIFNALGNSDELNSSIGMAREFCSDNSNQAIFKKLEGKLIKIQSVMLDIGSHIATPRTKAQPKQLERLSTFNLDLVTELENWIDEYDGELPILKNFILPSGGKTASSLHIARSVCRRLERSLQPLLQSNDIDPNAVIYVNRLSDFLFMAARYAAMKENKEEIIYKKT